MSRCTWSICCRRMARRVRRRAQSRQVRIRLNPARPLCACGRWPGEMRWLPAARPAGRAPVNAQEYLLHHVLGVVGVAQNSIGDLEDETCVLANAEFESRELVCAIKHRGLLRVDCEANWIRRHCSRERHGSPFSLARTDENVDVFRFFCGSFVAKLCDYLPIAYCFFIISGIVTN